MWVLLYVNLVKKDLKLRKLEALLKRGDKHSAIKKDVSIYLRGYKGEKHLTYYLDFIPEKDCFIINNLRLYDGKSYFQIDYLLLTHCFFIIIDCKNYLGTLLFDTNLNQFTRTRNNQEEGYLDPISQVKRLKHQLESFLQKRHFPIPPIEPIVIISKPSTIIKGNPSIKSHVLHSHSFLEKWDQLQRKYKGNILDDKNLRKISKFLRKHHTPDHTNVLEKYNLSKEDIITGVQCPHCMAFAMVRKKRSWFCPSCSTFDRKAHIKAVEDYFLLIKPSITSKEFREFVHISSKDTANRLLVSMKLPYTGENRGRIYYPTKDFLE